MPLLLASLFLSCSTKDSRKVGAFLFEEDFTGIHLLNLPDSLLTIAKNQPENAQLEVYILDASDRIREGQLPVTGNHKISNGWISFTPSFKFTSGARYLVRFRLGSFFLEERFQIPLEDMTPVAKVKEIYPSATVLPRNLLKFYIQFSDSMAQRSAYKNITLLNAAGDTIKDAFLELEEELWSSDMKRFTLLLDPGRIKRGLGSQDDLGYTFSTGQAYQLHINAEWIDAHGRQLTESFVKAFSIGADDRSKPDIKTWRLEYPEKQTQSPLQIHFGEPIDYALAQRVITVLDGQGETVDGSITLSDKEQLWSFEPSQNWTQGNYTIRVQLILEDLAGNNLKNLFDVDNQEVDTNLSNETRLDLPFSIN